MTEFIIPARLSEDISKMSKNLALKAHRALGCRDFSRVDFIVDESNVFVIEVNTIPGMTELSDIPAEAKAMGMGYDELVERILKLAMKRYGM
ncbi:D-alanine--D-alanine ligase [subsurface metagenome]|jgi:D-alanine-D-alanine ligase